MPADTGGEHIHALLDETAGEGMDFFGALAARHEVQQGDPPGEQGARADGVPDRGSDLEGEGAPALGVPAPTVAPTVRRRGQELVDEVALGAHDLHTVIPGLDRGAGSGGELADGAVDAAAGQASGAEGGERRAPARRGGRERMEGVAPGVQQLQQNPPARLVDRISDLPVGAEGARGDLAAARGEATGAIG